MLDRYIKELFGAHSEKQSLEEVHARYYLALLDTVIDDQGNERGEVLPVLKPEMENIDKAWRYATDQAWVEELFRSSKALQNFASFTAQYRFGDVLIKYSLDKMPEDAINLKTVLMANLSVLKYWVGKHEEAIDLARAAYELLEHSNIQTERALSITRLIFGVMQSSYSSIGNFSESLRVSREVFSILREKAPNTPAYSNALASLAIQERDILGNYDPQPFYEALSIAEQQSKVDVPWLLVSLSESLIMLNELEKAEEALLRAEKVSQQMNLSHWFVMSQHRLAMIKLRQGKIWESIKICHFLLDEVQRHNKPSLTAIVYQLAGTTEVVRGNSQRAWDYYMKALTQANAIKSFSLINSIKVDILEWTLKEDDGLALQLKAELEEETARMYFHDRERFANLSQTIHLSS